MYIFQKHLRQYGYAKGDPNERTGLTDSELAKAISAYQKFFNLPITGNFVLHIGKITMSQIYLFKVLYIILDNLVLYHIIYYVLSNWVHETYLQSMPNVHIIL